jgi:hypothetical protein
MHIQLGAHQPARGRRPLYTAGRCDRCGLTELALRPPVGRTDARREVRSQCRRSLTQVEDSLNPVEGIVGVPGVHAVQAPDSRPLASTASPICWAVRSSSKSSGWLRQQPLSVGTFRYLMRGVRRRAFASAQVCRLWPNQKRLRYRCLVQTVVAVGCNPRGSGDRRQSAPPDNVT